MKFWQSVGAISCVWLSGCNQVPTPTGGIVSKSEPGEAKPVVPSYRLVVAPLLEFTEGQLSEYKILASVPSPGTTFVKIAGLPPGATFDSATHTLSWKPEFDAAGETHSSFDQTFPIRIELSGFPDGITTVSRESTIRVLNVLRPLTLKNLPTILTVDEGETLSQEIKIDSIDFPKGPFAVHSSDLPAGAIIMPTQADPSTFLLTYSPNYQAVRKQVGTLFKRLNFTVTGPASQSLQHKVSMRVYHVDQSPIVSSPDELTAGETATFMIGAADPNGESPPEILIANASTLPGNIRIVRTIPYPGRNGNLPSSQAIVEWSNIPTDQMGTPHKANFLYCVYRGTRCNPKTVAVTFTAQVQPTPTIARGAWTFNTVQYLKNLETHAFPLAIQGPNEEAIKSVEIQGDTENAVSWNNGSLSITPKTTGSKTFIVVAKALRGGVTQETFNYEVLPETWSPVLILGDGLRDPEVELAHKAFPGAAVYNPALLVNADQILALRNIVIWGTSAFEQELDPAFLKKVFEKIPSVVIATPKLEKIPAELLGLDVLLKGRYLSRTELPALKKVRLWPISSQFSQPTQGGKLQGKLTAESPSPMTLSTGGPSCNEAFAVKENAQLHAVLALSCSRKLNSGKTGTLLVAGFEWRDVDLGTGREFLLKWIQESVKP